MTSRMITVERVYEPTAEPQAVRLLVDRLWPRGVRREELVFDDWSKDLAPSTELRKWYGHQVDRFEVFRNRYVAQLDAFPVREYVERISPSTDVRPITLLTAGKDLPHSHALILADYLRSNL